MIDNNPEIVEDRQALINKMLARWRRHKAPKDLKSLNQRLDEYFQACAELSLLPSVETLALCLGIDRSTLYRWKAGKYRSAEWREAINSAYQVILSATAIAGNEQRIPPLLTIWREKQLGSHDGISFEEQALRGSEASEIPYRLPSEILAEYESLPKRQEPEVIIPIKPQIPLNFEEGTFIPVPDDYDEDNKPFM